MGIYNWLDDKYDAIANWYNPPWEKQIYDEIRAKQMSDEEYGKVYQQNIFQAHPEAEPRGFWGNLGNAVTGGIIDDYHASKWADEQIDIQEASRKWSPQSPPYKPPVASYQHKKQEARDSIQTAAAKAGGNFGTAKNYGVTGKRIVGGR